MGRYKSDGVIKRGKSRGSPLMATKLRQAHAAKQIDSVQIVIGSATRLDHLAFQYMGDPSYWWAIAALSNIGWGLQLPPGTLVVIPTNIKQIKAIE